MTHIFLNIENSSLYKNIIKNPVPKLLVLVIDIVCIAVGCLCLLFSDSLPNEGLNYSSYWYLLQILAILIVYGFTDFIAKSYQCIIRLSVIEDLFKVLLMIIASTILLNIINAIFIHFVSIPFIGYWNIFIIAAISFTLLSLVRFSIKYAFIKLSPSTSNKKPVIVLGSALNSIVLANALKNEVAGQFETVALLSITGTNKKNNTINRLHVENYSPDTICDVFEKYNTKTLIFLSTQIDFVRDGFGDILLQNGISLLLLNQIEEFDISTDNKETPVSAHIKNIQIEDLLGREQINPDNSLVKSNITGECVLITGAAGSIGSEIVRQVASFKASKIVLVDQAETPMHNMQLEMREKFPDINIELFVGDVVNKDRMELAFSKFNPRFVFHAAAYKHVPMMEINPTEAIITNVMGTKNIADLSLKYGVYKFVMISTDKAVNPTNVMGATKRLSEIYVQSLFFNEKMLNPNKQSTQFITTRFGNVLGSNGSVIPLFRSQIEKGGPVTITHKDIIRYFMTIKEACSLVLEAGCMGNGGEIYIFDMGTPVKIYDLATRMITLAGLRVNDDIKIIETGLRPGEKLYEELLNDKEKTLATVNNKIMIAKVQKYDYSDVCTHIKSIIDFAQKGNTHDMILSMKSFIPEYKSMNSSFVKIDKELEASIKQSAEV